VSNSDHIQLAHGGGGRLTRELIEKEILTRFGGGALAGLPDAASLPVDAGTIVFTTDSFVVQPPVFPGGNIGSLAVHGTVNDLAVCGAVPKWISMGLILEEGLPLAFFRAIMDSLRDAAAACGVQVVTGDTKVVARGQCDGIYVNTSGIGVRLPGFDLGTHRIAPGDSILVSGPIAQHGAAVIACREQVDIRHGPESDSAPVHRLVSAIGGLAPDMHFMRDPTRGGLAGVLYEAAQDCGMDFVIDESRVPVSAPVRAVCELLGLDPLHVACEGRLVAIGATPALEGILERWRDMPDAAGAAMIGRVAGPARPQGRATPSGRVTMETTTGGRRLIDLPRGELLPRIC
jgi:hydrogenase expression/formation protein HypE